MRTLIVAVIGWIACAGVAPADPPARDEIRADAERAFDLGVKHQARLLQSRKHFATAADRYLELHQQGVRDPALYLNLGNAAFLADRWPEALWAYHVGLKLDPNDARLRGHREHVRAKVLLPQYGQGRNEAERWPAWLYRPSLDLYAIIAGAAYALAWLAGTVALFRRSLLLALVAGLAIIIAAVAVFGWWHDHTQAQIDRATPLVILADNTPLFRGNGPNYPSHPDIAILPRGMEARQLHQRGGWLQIRLTSGEIGWIPAAVALVVAP